MEVYPCLALSMPGGGEWLIILVVVLLLFGSKKLPELARSLGKSVSEFKKGQNEFQNALSDAAKEDEKADSTPKKA